MVDFFECGWPQFHMAHLLASSIAACKNHSLPDPACPPTTRTPPCQATVLEGRKHVRISGICSSPLP